jgi:hypothetical protein
MKKVVILIVIVALVFYLLSQETKPVKPKSPPWPLAPKPKPNLVPSPSPYVLPPSSPEPLTHWPSDNSLNCPAAKTELTPAEKAQRLAQEQADYAWLMSHKTLADWKTEAKISNAQYQVLSSLVAADLMETVEYFLAKLPAEWEWKLVNSEFTPEMVKAWKQAGFSAEEVKEWLEIGLGVKDACLARWLRDIKRLGVEAVLNFGDLGELRREFENYVR